MENRFGKEFSGVQVSREQSPGQAHGDYIFSGHCLLRGHTAFDRSIIDLDKCILPRRKKGFAFLIAF